MFRTICVLFLCIALPACLRTNTTMIDDRTAIVSGKGSGLDSRAEVLQKVLVEAANATKAHGFDYFVILDAANTSETESIVTPGQTYSSGYATGTGSVYGGTVTSQTSYSGYSWSTPGTVSTVVRPGADVMIRMYASNEVEDSRPGVWDAASILATQGE